MFVWTGGQSVTVVLLLQPYVWIVYNWLISVVYVLENKHDKYDDDDDDADSVGAIT